MSPSKKRFMQDIGKSSKHIPIGSDLPASRSSHGIVAQSLCGSVPTPVVCEKLPEGLAILYLDRILALARVKMPARSAVAKSCVRLTLRRIIRSDACLSHVQ